MCFCLNRGLCKVNTWNKVIEGELVAGAASEQAQTAEPRWVCKTGRHSSSGPRALGQQRCLPEEAKAISLYCTYLLAFIRLWSTMQYFKIFITITSVQTSRRYAYSADCPLCEALLNTAVSCPAGSCLLLFLSCCVWGLAFNWKWPALQQNLSASLPQTQTMLAHRKQGGKLTCRGDCSNGFIWIHLNIPDHLHQCR